MGLVSWSLVGCFLLGESDDDCASPNSPNASRLISDCSGTYCERDADCPTGRVCNRRAPGANIVESGIPIGCRPMTENGDAGGGP
jgi:hypothetical protein